MRLGPEPRFPGGGPGPPLFALRRFSRSRTKQHSPQETQETPSETQRKDKQRSRARAGHENRARSRKKREAPEKHDTAAAPRRASAHRGQRAGRSARGRLGWPWWPPWCRLVRADRFFRRERVGFDVSDRFRPNPVRSGFLGPRRKSPKYPGP